MKYDYAQISCAGKKEHNADAVAVKTTQNGFLAAVADSTGAKHAANRAIELLLEGFDAENPPKERLFGTLIEQTDAKLCEEASEGCSFACIYTNASECVIAHAGDSRAYVIRSGDIIFHTVDQSEAGKMAATGELSRDEIANNPQRRVLLGIMGKGDYCVRVELPYLRLQEGDAVIVCTDGFWAGVSEQEMLIDLVKARSAKDWLEYMTCRISSRLKILGDNFTAAAVFCGEMNEE